jgi:hypothetical protein
MERHKEPTGRECRLPDRIEGLLFGLRHTTPAEYYHRYDTRHALGTLATGLRQR